MKTPVHHNPLPCSQLLAQALHFIQREFICSKHFLGHLNNINGNTLIFKLFY